MAKSNSNMVITGYKVDPTTQQITSLEVNGEAVETGGEPNLQNKSVDIRSMDQFDSFATGMYVKEVEPSEGYDGMSKATLMVSALLFAVDNMKMVTLIDERGLTTKKVVITNSNVVSFSYVNIDVFSGKLYVPQSSSSTGNLSNTSYTLGTGSCGEKTVTIGTTTFNRIKLGWD